MALLMMQFSFVVAVIPIFFVLIVVLGSRELMVV